MVDDTFQHSVDSQQYTEQSLQDENVPELNNSGYNASENINVEYSTNYQPDCSPQSHESDSVLQSSQSESAFQNNQPDPDRVHDLVQKQGRVHAYDLRNRSA